MKTKFNQISFVIFILILIACSFAKKNKKIKPGLSGVVEVGYSYENQGFKDEKFGIHVYNEETVFIGEAELEVELKVHPSIKGRFELKGDHNTAGIKIDDCWVQFGFKKGSRLRIGNQRKVLGLEGLHGSKKRSTVFPSFINRYIRTFGILEHDPLVRFKSKNKNTSKSLETEYYITAGFDGDVKVFANPSLWIEWENGLFGFSDLYTWRWNKKYYPQTNSNISVLSLEHFPGFWFNSVEVFVGLDPNASDITRRMGEFRKIYFSAAKIATRFKLPLSIGYISGIEPLFSGTYLFNDLKNTDEGYLELIGGINFCFDTKKPVRWMSEFSTVYAHNHVNVLWGRASYRIASQVQLIW